MMLKTTNIISIIMIFSLLSCSNNDIYKNRKIPAQNSQYLSKSGNEKMPSAKPNTNTQYGYYGETPQNSNFYNSLLSKNQKKKSVPITDEVATNNLPAIKESLIAYSEREPEQKQIKQPLPAKPSVEKHTEAFFIQIGAYSNPKNASYMKSLMSQYGNTIIRKDSKNKKILNKVQIGPIHNLNDTLKLQKKLGKEGYSQTIIIRDGTYE